MSDDGWEEDENVTPIPPSYNKNSNYQEKNYNDRSVYGHRSYNYDRERTSGYDRDYLNRNRNRDTSSNYKDHSWINGRETEYSYKNDDENCSGSVNIQPNKVGMVIGRRGVKIREIQTNFNVNINVDKSVGHNGLCSVKIKGADKDIEKAKQFIEDLVNESPNIFEKVTKQQFSDVEKKVEEPLPNIDWRSAYLESEKNALKKWEHFPAVIKKFYQEDFTISQLTKIEVDAFREANNNITVERSFKNKSLCDDSIPNPVNQFVQCFRQYPDLLHEIQRQGFQRPTPIQCQAWPVLLKGEDMIGIAQTGTGKTLAFLLPAMIHTEYQTMPRDKRTGPTVLVMAPTRELAIQIEKEVVKYNFRNMRAVCVYGGGDRKAQVQTVEKGVEIVIATPGRLNDLVQANIIDLMHVSYVVLDEADRMLDMGFEPQIRKILMLIRPDKQTVMTSATWPLGVRRLAEKYMLNPLQVCIGSLDLAAVHSVQQIIEILDEEDKFYKIMHFAKTMSSQDKAIIFCGKKARADDLSSEMSLKGFDVQCIHGDRDQADREQALADIKSGLATILIATDVASRGIDIEDITHVVNYDFPRNIEEYVHRVGRTGRAGRTGTSISYVTRADWGSAGELIDILEEADQQVPRELYEMKERFEAKKRAGGFIRRTGMKFSNSDNNYGENSDLFAGFSGGDRGRNDGRSNGGGRSGGRRW